MTPRPDKFDPLEAVRARIREMADADPETREAELARLKEEVSRELADLPRRQLEAIRAQFERHRIDIDRLWAAPEVEAVFQVPESWRPAPKPRKRRGGRPPIPIPADLRRELEQRFDHPGDRRYTQEAIAERLGINRGRVRRAEKRLRPN